MTHYTFQKIIVPIKGMHCRSCELMLEEKFSHVEHVEKCEVDYRQGSATIFYSEHKPEMKKLEDAVMAAGYEIGKARPEKFLSHNPKDYKELFQVIFYVIIGYGILKLLGITDLINFNSDASEPSFGMVALIGLVAGFSSCMALVGGLVLGISAKHAEKHPEATPSQKFRPHLYFNIGRIAGYAILGGLLGSLGSIFKLSTGLTGLLTLFASAVMLIMGLQLIGIFPKINAWKLTLPKSLSKLFGTNRHRAEYNHKNSILVGALTFFLPCGFTQAMQVFAVSTGNFISGAMIMSLFALGTAPGLLSIGGITSALKGSAAKKFFKIAGVVVIIFAYFNISNSLALAGIKFGNNGNVSDSAPAGSNVELVDGVQIVKMTESFSGYSPNSFTIQKGIPVRWIIDAKSPYSCASNIIMPKFGINKNLTPGENTIEFTAKETGVIPFSCGMGMYTGSFTVVEQGSQASSTSTANQKPSIQTSCGSCGSSGGCGCGKPNTSTNTALAPSAPAPAPSPQPDKTEEQVINTSYTLRKDIQPNNFIVKTDIPVKFLIDVKDNGQGCMSEIMIENLYENPKYLEKGKTLEMDFTPTKKGKYLITCAMGVPRGTITVE